MIVLGRLCGKMIVVMVMMMMMTGVSHCMASIAARSYILQAFKAVIGARITMQLEIKIVLVADTLNVNERLGGAVWTFRTVPSQILRRRCARTLAQGASY